MKKTNLITMEFLLVALLASGVIVSCTEAKGPSGDETPLSTENQEINEWKDLFEPDLSNAVFEPGGWVMEKGVLRALDHANIWTKESFGNFILELEFKVAENANSGVFLRAGDINDVLSALEIQIHETSDGGKYGMVAALYDAKAPDVDASRPAGEWNRYRITCNDSQLQVVFNEKLVHDIDLNDWDEPHKNPDGTENKFAKALKDFSRSGPIGLQGIHGEEGQPVWFRSLRIKTLD